MNSGAQKTSESEVRCLNVVFSEKGVSEFAGKRRVVFISRDRLQMVEIKYGWQAERPLLQVVAALLLILLGAAGTLILADGGLGTLRWGLGFVFFGALGAWLLLGSLQRGYYIRLTCPNDLRKVAIRGHIQKVEFRELIQSAAKLGYDIRDSLE